MDDDSLYALFSEYCKQYGVVLTSTQIGQFQRYAYLLQEGNTRINLTSILDSHGIVMKHFLDSVAVIPSLQMNCEGTLLDVGSGAGFPGIVLKLILPSLQVTLCDSLQKRTRFLIDVIEDLGLHGIQVIHGRAEELATKDEFRDHYQVVTARAVANLSVLCELCLPFVVSGGKMIALKGPSGTEEVIQANKAISALNGRLLDVIEYELPEGAGKRSLVCIQKTAVTPKKFPRRPGDAQRSPL